MKPDFETRLRWALTDPGSAPDAPQINVTVPAPVVHVVEPEAPKKRYRWQMVPRRDRAGLIIDVDFVPVEVVDLPGAHYWHMTPRRDELGLIAVVDIVPMPLPDMQ